MDPFSVYANLLLQSEMVISNIGTIVAALPAAVSDQATLISSIDNTPHQVRLISIANTLTRILVGPLADYVSPVASYLPNGTIVHVRKHRISRVSFLLFSALLSVLTFFWSSFGIITQDGIWILRYVARLFTRRIEDESYPSVLGLG